MKKILVINGPNLNFLGIREKNIYGSESYDKLCEYIYNYAKMKNIIIEIKQTNYEGEIINFLQKAYYDKVDGILINPGAYTHYSYAIFDCIKSIDIPTIEVHLSDIKAREDFRKISVISPACIHQIYGKGKDSYIEGIKYLMNIERGM